MIIPRARLDWVLAAGCALLLPAAWMVWQKAHGTSAGAEMIICGVLAATVGFNWLSYRIAHRSLRSLHTQLRHIRRPLQTGLVPANQAKTNDPAEARVAGCLSALQREMEDLQQAKGMLDIRCRIEAHRRREIEQILLLVSDAVLIINRFDELIFANRTAEELLEFSLQTCQRKQIGDIIRDGALVGQVRDFLAESNRQFRQVVEYTCDSHDSPRTFRIWLHCLDGPNAQPAGVVAVLHDITREKEIERSKTEFVSNVSHELKTPLASIKAYIEMLLDGEVNDPAGIREFYETIAGETNRLHRMVDRILDVSRIESGMSRVVREPVNMTAVVKQVAGMVLPQARAKAITLRQHLPSRLYQVEADYDLLCQAVQNLLSNAIKYTPNGGTVSIRVTVQRKRGLAVIEVADTGIGIEAEELPRIFEKFYRVRANMKMAPGTGLGLPLVKFIVETIHRGKLTVTSQPKKGSVFRFELPLVT